MNFKNAILVTRKLYNLRAENHMKDDRIVPDPWMLRSQFKELIEEQENGKLFYRGMDDLPAVILYRLDETIDSNPKIIKKVARGLYSLKGKQTHKDLQEFSDMLKSERTRKWKIPVPLRISKNIQCFYTTALYEFSFINYGWTFFIIIK